jgi:hypothetical protein
MYSSFQAIMKAPSPMLLSAYDADTFVVHPYLYVSEKYDGWRLYFRNGTFYTRNGNPLALPADFADALNKHKGVEFDGELWMGYGTTSSDVTAFNPATVNPDIPLIIPMQTESLKINIEAKNKGAFEGGCKKLDSTPQGMEITEDCIQKFIMGDKTPYNGCILPWTQGLRTFEDWQKVKHIFEKDVYMEAAEDAVAVYYAKKGTHYIQIEGKGLYHTGADPLDLGVPMFKSKVVLRIRCTKHMRKIGGQRVPTDITAALQFNRHALVASPYTLDEGGQLPSHVGIHNKSHE